MGGSVHHQLESVDGPEVVARRHNHVESLRGCNIREESQQELLPRKEVQVGDLEDRHLGTSRSTGTS